MRVKVGTGKVPLVDLQVSDKVVIVLLLLLGSNAADAVPIVLHLLRLK